LRDDVPPRFYVPVDQVDQSVGGVPASIDFEVRTTGDPERMLISVRKAVLSVNGDVSISNARPLGELVDTYNAQARLIAKLCTIFAIIALLLAATGLYGVLSYRVARRTNEIGIRMALGSGQGEVIRMILRETSLLVAIGLIAGLLATSAGTRLIATQLYGLTATDPLTLAIAVCVLSAIALISGYIPAARAARVNPVNALRHE
jgi:ABC-type antimicrobial peptide transport system permease subunit